MQVIDGGREVQGPGAWMTEPTGKPPQNVPHRGWPPSKDAQGRPVQVVSPSVIRGDPLSTEPNWEVVPRVKHHTLDKGEELEIQLYYCGYGIPDWAKVSFYPPLGLFKSRPHPQTGWEGFGTLNVEHSISTGVPPGVDEHNIPAGTRMIATKDIYPIPIDEYGSSSAVPLAVFFPLLIAPKPDADPVVDWGKRVVGEVDVAESNPTGPDLHRPPTRITAIISQSADPGDYSIPIILTYSAGGRIKSSTSRLEFHLKSFWERAWFQTVVGISAGIAIAAAVITVLEWFGGMHL